MGLPHEERYTCSIMVNQVSVLWVLVSQVEIHVNYEARLTGRTSRRIETSAASTRARWLLRSAVTANLPCWRYTIFTEHPNKEWLEATNPLVILGHGVLTIRARGTHPTFSNWFHEKATLLFHNINGVASDKSRFQESDRMPRYCISTVLLDTCSP